MNDRRHPRITVAVEEVRYDDLELRTAADAAESGRRRRPTRSYVCAVVGALSIGAAAIAILDSDDGADEAAPTTTEPGPISVTSGDRRAQLAGLPDGFRPTTVRAIGGGPIEPAITAVLYGARGATATDDQWILAVVSPTAASLPIDVGFVRPPRTTFVGALPGAAGQTALGDETVSFDLPEGRITLTASGLPPGITEKLARHVRVLEGVAHVPDTDLPAGLEQQPGWRVPRGLRIADALAPGIGRAPGWQVTYRAADGATIDVVASSIGAGEADAVVPLSNFVLNHATATTVHGHQAVVGRAAGTAWVVWTEDGALVTMSLTGRDPAAIVSLADSLRLASDPRWDEEAWSAALRATSGERPDDNARMRIVGRGPLAGPTSWWDVTARVVGTELAWTLRTGHNSVGASPTGDARTAPLTAPLTLDVAGEQMYSREPHGADAGELSDWYAAAIAVGDISFVGAVLRLTTDGFAPETLEIALAPVREIDGYVFAAVVLPWTAHYTVEIIGTDGTVLTSTADTGDA